eukprot:CAMPEP_0180566256 /NCGR_PEP_ID=MMETSP1037_2-20121125/5976_1 /TAXON_ID=632150 /ORGANISM="Azadinium spinosum, Strain 3D9" /LENGTH=32 /DNA_ID= /DNA_START= /DNA_END= /DNA_ORIENTATION=
MITTHDAAEEEAKHKQVLYGLEGPRVPPFQHE